MDAETKEQLRFKFYRLAIQLNAVVLLAALTVMALFIAREPYRLPLVLALVLLVVYLAIRFTRKYHETRAWLSGHADKDKGDGKPP